MLVVGPISPEWDEIIPGAAFADLREIQDNIKAEYGEWITATAFHYADGEWTIDSMEPFEWAEAMFGEGE
jgi:hypothetical protein